MASVRVRTDITVLAGIPLQRVKSFFVLEARVLSFSCQGDFMGLCSAYTYFYISSGVVSRLVGSGGMHT